MRLSSFAVRSASLFLLLPGAAVLPAYAQTFAAVTGTTPIFAGDVPDRIPSALPAHHKKTDLPLMYARVRDGVYSVDGLVGKVRLNYDVKAANYLYLFVPGVGTALVSLAPSADAVWMPAAYRNGQLTLRVAEHTLNLTGIESLVNDRGKEPASLYVRLDRSAWRLGRTPMVGFGTTTQAPYEWPGALAAPAVAADNDAAPVPVPTSLLPRPVAYQVTSNETR